MIISFTGAHGTGKSTLVIKLQKNPLFQGFRTSDNITRCLIADNIPINEQGNDITQILIMSTHIRNSLYKDALLSRCALDGFCYTEWLYIHGQVSEWVRDFAKSVLYMLQEKYRYIFYLEPEFVPASDDVRSASIGFHTEIVDLFRASIKHFSIPVIKITGSVEERYCQVLAAIQQRG